MKIQKFTLLAPFAALVLAAPGCNRHPSAPPATASQNSGNPKAVVRIATAMTSSRELVEQVPATLRARKKATIEAKASGRIESITVTQGQTVTAGQLLARLQLGEVQARLEQAIAQNDQAERDFKRLSVLVEQKAVTLQEFDASKARTMVTRAAIAEARAMLAFGEITAPFDGVVSRKTADAGDMANPGKPLFEIEDPSSLRVEADVPESLVAGLAIGSKLTVTLPALGRDQIGTVSEISPAADPATRTFLVKLDLAPLNGLRSGYFARVAVPSGKLQAIRVPRSALLLRGQLEMVFIEDSSTARMRLVRSGYQSSTEVELLAGVEAGEKVVIEGAKTLVDGQALEVRP